MPERKRFFGCWSAWYLCRTAFVHLWTWKGEVRLWFVQSLVQQANDLWCLGVLSLSLSRSSAVCCYSARLIDFAEQGKFKRIRRRECRQHADLFLFSVSFRVAWRSGMWTQGENCTPLASSSYPGRAQQQDVGAAGYGVPPPLPPKRTAQYPGPAPPPAAPDVQLRTTSFSVQQERHRLFKQKMMSQSDPSHVPPQSASTQNLPPCGVPPPLPPLPQRPTEKAHATFAPFATPPPLPARYHAFHEPQKSQTLADTRVYHQPSPSPVVTQVFGVDPASLPAIQDNGITNQLLTPADLCTGYQVPVVLVIFRLALYRQNGISAEGIFRLSGNESLMKQIQRNPPSDPFTPLKLDIHSAATLIKVPLL